MELRPAPRYYRLRSSLFARLLESHAPVMAARLQLPRLPEGIISRPRPLERLNGVLKHKLTLVIAGAGYGKTTLLTEWCAGQPSLAVSWLTLTRAEQNPTRFWYYLAAALANLAAASPATRAANPQAEDLLSLLLNHLAGTPGESVLIIDNYQLVSDSAEIRDMLAYLLDNLPPRLHLVIASRNNPGLALGRLRANREVLELSPADLRFCGRESLDLLRQAARPALKLEEIMPLQRRVEGWAAGLQMAALSLNRQPESPAAQLLNRFNCRHGPLKDYFSEEIFSKLPVRFQSFLLLTAPVERLCASLAEVLADCEDAQAILETLGKDSGFLVPLDEEGEWYRYHRLLAGYLRERLAQQYPDRLAGLHRRAAGWFERAGLLAEGIDHALEAGEFDHAAGLLEAAAENLLKRGESQKLYCWLYRLPARLLALRPRLQMFYALTLALLGQPAASARLETLSDPPLAKPVLAIRTVLATCDSSGGSDPVAVCGEILAELTAAPTTYWQALACFNLSRAFQAKGRWPEAVSQWQTTLRLAEQVGASDLAVQAVNQLADLVTLQGYFHRAAELYRRALRLAGRYELAENAVAGMIHQGLADRLYEWNDLAGAEKELDKAFAIGHACDDAVLVATTYLRLFTVRQAQGNYPAALEALQEAEILTQKYCITQLPDWLLLFRVRLCTLQGNLREAERLAALISPAAHTEDWQQAKLTQLTRLRLALKSPDTALKLVEEGDRQAGEWGFTFRKIRWLVLRALALELGGKTRAALALLSDSLKMAGSEGYLRVFLDEGPALTALLQKLPVTDYSARLLQFGQAAALPSGRTGEKMLSQREINVLRLVAAGYSNQAIAGQLVISVSTVKAHVHHILGKLEAASRTEALARARHLNLL